MTKKDTKQGHETEASAQQPIKQIKQDPGKTPENKRTAHIYIHIPYI